VLGMNCHRRPSDVAGARCMSCDPVVSATIYGLPRDGFRRVTELVVVEGGVIARIDRHVMLWGAVDRIDVKVSV